MPDLHRKAKRTDLTIEVVIAVAWSGEEQCYFAWSPQLGCMRDGETEEQAISLFREAVEVRLESWIERGTLEENLAQHGYIRSNVKGAPKYDRVKGHIFDRSAVQAMTFSESISLQRVDEISISPGATAVGIR